MQPQDVTIQVTNLPLNTKKQDVQYFMNDFCIEHNLKIPQICYIYDLKDVSKDLMKLDKMRQNYFSNNIFFGHQKRIERQHKSKYFFR